MPMKNHVDGAMLQQELAALETFGQLFTNSLLDNTRTGETDQRIRFRNVQIAQHGKTCGNATEYRVGHDRDIGNALLLHALKHGGRLGHLHQRQDCLLHPCATAGRETHQWNPLFQAHIGRLNELFTHDLPHGAAKEVEFKGHRNQRNIQAGATHGNQGIFLASGFLVLAQAILVTLAVLELQAVPRFQISRDLLAAVGVQENIQTTAGSYPQVMLALGAHVQILIQLRLVQKRPALGTFLPQTFRNTGPLFGFRADLARHDLVQPVTHDLILSFDACGNPTVTKPGCPVLLASGGADPTMPV